MPKVIDISDKLTNDRPVLKLGGGKEYPIDNRKNTLLTLQKHMDNSELSDVEKAEEALRFVLGEKAVAEINEMDLTFETYQTLFIATIAGALGEDFDAVEARFQAAGKDV